MKPKIAIIDYKAGNLASVHHALTRIGADHFFSHNSDELAEADGVIFPGVGHAKPAMESLEETGVDQFIKTTKQPLLGICLGMQLLFSSSEEGDSDGLGLFEGRLKKFSGDNLKVPHMGWNIFAKLEPHPLVKNIRAKNHFYYVHSYYAPVIEESIGVTQYGNPFTSIVARDNIYGVQFHPEKSGAIGEQLLTNFINLISESKA